MEPKLYDKATGLEILPGTEVTSGLGLAFTFRTIVGNRILCAAPATWGTGNAPFTCPPEYFNARISA